MYIHKCNQHTDSSVIEQTVLSYQKQCYVDLKFLYMQMKITRSHVCTHKESQLNHYNKTSVEAQTQLQCKSACISKACTS